MKFDDNMSSIWALEMIANEILEICNRVKDTHDFSNADFKDLVMRRYLLNEEIKDISKLSPDFDQSAKQVELLSALGNAIANDLNSDS